MDLTEIRNPDFLKSMSMEELEDLARDIRTFLIHSISKTGGHLASNLGVVELTIALHYVFDSPRDRIFFDVGHQCYTHKILTGRAERFNTLRQYRGLSGFEKRKESVHDVWEAGHSSTSLSAALGMAVARDLDGDDYCIVPVIGDGALTSGMALEALNEIGSEKKRMIIIFNDNNMSISRNVGALTSAFSRLRSSRGYLNIKKNLKRNLKNTAVGENLYKGLVSMRDSIKDQVVDKGIFGEYGIDYIGPVDGHNIHDLVQVLEAVKDHEGPIVVHVITRKGKGYAPCENDRTGYWHGVGPFNPSTGRPLHDTPAGYQPWAAVMTKQVMKEAAADSNVVAITPAMANGSCLNAFFAKYPKRSFDTGIAEEHAATFAASLALNGKRPYYVVYSSFLQRCYDQINHDIARMDAPVVIGVDHAGIVGSDGETHHGIYDVGLLTGMPNMIVSQPCDANETMDLVHTAFATKHPFAIRFAKNVIPFDESYNAKIIDIGSWTMFNDEPDHTVAVLTYGENVIHVLEKVKSNHLPVTVVNCRFFKPLDKNMIRTLAERNMRCITYEGDALVHGLGSLILEYANAKNISISLRRIGIPDIYVQHGSERLLRRELHIDMNTLMDEIEKELKL
ncbi:MAG: 1-deoxy-D-xylulose-5-phosphate synthase [Bulleidia sp.]